MKTSNNVTREQMEQALRIVNKRFNGNIEFHPSSELGKHHFRLTVKDTKGPGAKVRKANGFQGGRRIKAACWHVHGFFFEALLSVNIDARVFTSSRLSYKGKGLNRKEDKREMLMYRHREGTVIDRNGGNWIDRNVGSFMYPAFASSQCECQSL